MNVLTLIDRHPLLQADLRPYRLPRASVKMVAEQISEQLGGAQRNLCYVLHGHTARSFVRATNTKAIAENAGIPVEIARAIVLTLAPWVGQFELVAN